MTTCEAVAALPQASLAVNTRITTVSPAQAPAALVLVAVMVGLLSHASVAVGKSVGSAAPHSIVTAAGTSARTGVVRSRTVTTCEAVAALPHASLAVNTRVTTVSPAQAPARSCSLQ